jgi:predicted ATP-dependent endonuclease of OLD family
MIKKIEIKNFKSILQLELELGRINVFIKLHSLNPSLAIFVENVQKRNITII